MVAWQLIAKPVTIRGLTGETAASQSEDMPEILNFSDALDHRKPVYTREGNIIPQVDFEDYEHWKKQQSVEEIQRRTDLDFRDLPQMYFSQRKVRSVAPFMYNCVGMIFASRRAWIEPEELKLIFDDDKYRKISRDELECGDIVIYTKGNERTHVGLVTCVQRTDGQIGPIYVLSKWGMNAEVEHRLDVVPAKYGRPSEYWSEKVQNVIA